MTYSQILTQYIAMLLHIALTSITTSHCVVASLSVIAMIIEFVPHSLTYAVMKVSTSYNWMYETLAYLILTYAIAFENLGIFISKVLSFELTAIWLDFLAIVHDQFSCPPPETVLFFWTRQQTPLCAALNRALGVPTVFGWEDLTRIAALMVFLLASCYMEYWRGYGPVTSTAQFTSRILGTFMRKPQLKPEHYRNAFRDSELKSFKPTPGHDHGVCAADRSRAVANMESIATSLGKRTYYIQCSRSDQRNDRHGSRTFFWTKDTQMDHADFTPDENDILCFVDVDQYIDIPTFMTQRKKLLSDLHVPTIQSC